MLRNIELGVLGLWLFAIFLVGVFSATRRRARELAGVDGALAAGVTAMVAAAAAACLTATYFEIFPLDLLFWVLVVVVASIGRDARPSSYTDVITMSDSRPTRLVRP